MRSHHIADGLDIGISLGSTGLGLNLQTSVTKWANIRAGVVWMPKIKTPLNFNISTYSDGLPTGNFSQVADLLYEHTGLTIDDNVKMQGEGSWVNFKFLVDIFPFQNNRHWHFTAGFFAGTSRIGKAYNDYSEKPTLVALNIYNRAYEYFIGLGDDVFDVPFGPGHPSLDPDVVENLQGEFRHYGRLGIRVGDFEDGSPYIMEPAPDGTISAKAFVNHFKPYLGAGYSTDLDKAGRWHFGIDAGCMFWGGAPDIIHYDYTTGRSVNFTKELKNFRGKVDTYMKAVKAFPVYPVVEISFSYTIL